MEGGLLPVGGEAIGGLFSALLDNARRFPEKKVAIAQKRRGIWVGYSWKEYAELIMRAASALKKIGVKEGQKVLLFGRNSPEWYISELALYGLGAMPITLYGRMDEEAVRSLLPEGLDFALVQGKEELGKLVAVFGRPPEKVVYWDYREMEGEERGAIWFWDLLKEEKGAFELPETARVLQPLFFVICAGSSKGPRGVFVKEQVLLDSAKAFLRLEEWSTKDRLMPFLPPVRSVDKVFTIYGHILSGSSLLIAEREETYAEDFKEAHPSVVYFTARVWERLYKGASQRLKGLRGFKRNWGLKVLKRELGLDGVKFCYNIGPFLSGEVYEFLGEMGLELKNIYWKAELGPITLTRGKGGTLRVGKPLIGREVSVEEGELVVSIPSNGVKGFRTGDLGILSPEGEVLLLGKRGEHVELNGKQVPLGLIESVLRLEPFVSDALVLQLEKGWLGVFLCPDEERLADWARERGLGVTSRAELYEIEEIKELFKETVKGVGEKMGVNFKGLCILPKSGFRVSEGELLVNGHLNRGRLKERFREVLAQMGRYEGNLQVEIEGAKLMVRLALVEGVKA